MGAEARTPLIRPVLATDWPDWLQRLTGITMRLVLLYRLRPDERPEGRTHTDSLANNFAIVAVDPDAHRFRPLPVSRICHRCSDTMVLK